MYISCSHNFNASVKRSRLGLGGCFDHSPKKILTEMDAKLGETLGITLPTASLLMQLLCAVLGDTLLIKECFHSAALEAKILAT